MPCSSNWLNTASTSGHAGFATISPYAASKHALVITRLAKLAAEAGEDSIDGFVDRLLAGLKPIAEKQGRVLHAEAGVEKGFYYRSDHFEFAKQGVPALDPEVVEDEPGVAQRSQQVRSFALHRISSVRPV